ncbi:hypothetical protein NE619_08510 [Anaerovorax odorimutans]|uniref:DUF4367 domain-containing protein n=1 Tax=Anaerovorax odorimutans TaxID=109327 RepID=A0ABT1RNK4_9FIRM|nr:hypothetical protein [Anaerovorax odorimutans]MCQ4636771.1 hypothetical protein [Anaerovorax odorimutans]
MGRNEKLHEELCKKMQEASEQYVRQTYEAPEIDPQLFGRIKQRQKRNTHKKVLRIAALFTVVLLGGISLSVWFNADGAYGGKRLIGKYVHLLSSSSIHEEVDEEGNRSEVMEIDNFENMKEAEDLIETLYVPKYIPEGYSFISLKVTKNADEEMYTYTYKNSTQGSLYIDYNFDNFDKDIMIDGEPYTSPRTGEKLYIKKIEETDEYTVVKVADRFECVINGIGDIEEGIRIMENLEKY